MNNAEPDPYDVCVHFGDCPYSCACEVDEPWAVCRHRVRPSKEDLKSKEDCKKGNP